MTRSIIPNILEFTCRTRLTRLATLTLVYTAAVALCFWTSYQIRFDFHVRPNFGATLLVIALGVVSAKLAALFAFHQLDGGLTFFGKPDLKHLVIAAPLARCLLPSRLLSAPLPRARLFRLIWCFQSWRSQSCDFVSGVHAPSLSCIAEGRRMPRAG